MSDTVKSYDPTELGVPEEDPNVLKDAEGNPLPVFDDKYKEDFKGLLYLGALSSDFEWLGHRFIIRTLRDGELLAVGQLIKPYQETVGNEIAYATAIAALCTVSVDDEPLPTPIGESGRINEWAVKRFNYVKDNWFSYTIDKIYQEYVLLSDKVNQVLDALGKVSAPTDSIPLLKDI